jgi:hypothetical protein
MTDNERRKAIENIIAELRAELRADLDRRLHSSWRRFVERVRSEYYALRKARAFPRARVVRK